MGFGQSQKYRAVGRVPWAGAGSEEMRSAPGGRFAYRLRPSGRPSHRPGRDERNPDTFDTSVHTATIQQLYNYITLHRTPFITKVNNVHLIYPLLDFIIVID